MQEIDKEPLPKSDARPLSDARGAEGGASNHLLGRLRGASHKSGVRVLRPKPKAELGPSGRDGGLPERRDASAEGLQGPVVGLEPPMVEAGAVDTATQNDIEPEAGAELIGLQRGDGLKPGTEPARPRVMELQLRLNASMLAELAVDGLFGPLTGRALREFQESLREPQQEFVDPTTAGALVGVPPPGFAPAGAGGPQPDQDQFERAAMFAGGVASGSVETGQNFMGAASMMSTQPITQQNLAVAGSVMTLQLPPYNEVEAELQLASRSETLASGAIGNPLVGVQRGDGLVFGTFDRRTRVRLLQTKLNDRGGASIAVDGKFGPLTAKALATFQASVAMPVSERVEADTADLLMGQDPKGGSSPDAAAAQAVQDAGASISEAGGLIRSAGPELSLVATSLAVSGDLTSVGAASEFVSASSNITILGANLDLMGLALRSVAAGPVGIEARAHVRKAAAALAIIADMNAQWGRALMAAGVGFVPTGIADAGVMQGLTTAGVAALSASGSLAFAASQLKLV